MTIADANLSETRFSEAANCIVKRDSPASKLNNVLATAIFFLLVINAATLVFVAGKLSIPPQVVLQEVVELRAAIETQGEKTKQARDMGELRKRCLSDSTMAWIEVNESGIVTMFSNGAEAMFGRKREEVIGYGIAWMLPNEALGDHTKHFKLAMEEDTVGIVYQVKKGSIALADGKAGDVIIELWYHPGSAALARITQIKTGA